MLLSHPAQNKSVLPKAETKLVKVEVWWKAGPGEPAKHDVLHLPNGAVRWEIQGDVGSYQSVRFIAVYPDGTIAKMIEYASGQWSRYEASAIS